MGRRKKGDTSTRDKILLVSRQLFADKGFDATSVDEIVETAGVNKSSVYYYFKSKREILQQLPAGFMEETSQLKKSMILNKDISKEDIRKSLELNKKYTDLVKIIWMELSKKSDEDIGFLEYLDQSFSSGLKMARQENLLIEDTPRNRVMMIFMATLPIFGYTVLGEKLCKYYAWDEKDFTEDFIQVYHDVYIEALEKIVKPIE